MSPTPPPTQDDLVTVVDVVDTLEELVSVGFDPVLLDRPGGWWEP